MMRFGYSPRGVSGGLTAGALSGPASAPTGGRWARRRWPRGAGGRLVDRVGDRPAANLGERGAARIVGIDQAGGVARQQLEQAALGLKVGLHVGGEIQMVAREGCEDPAP